MRNIKFLLALFVFSILILCCDSLPDGGSSSSTENYTLDMERWGRYEGCVTYWNLTVYKFGVYTLEFIPILDEFGPEDRQRIERATLKPIEINFQDIGQKVYYKFEQHCPADFNSEVDYLVKVSFKPKNPSGTDTLLIVEKSFLVFDP